MPLVGVLDVVMFQSTCPAVHGIACLSLRFAIGCSVDSGIRKVSSLDTQVAADNPFLPLGDFASFMHHAFFAMAM